MDDAYTVFAQVYDLFMDEIPYEQWAEYLTGLLWEEGICQGLVAELGCGTGTMTRLLRDAGYDMIGIDASPDMLYAAREKGYADASILYLQQRMQDLELYGTVKAFVSVCDSMNYILTEEELLTVFRKVNNYLDSGGCFIFDMKTEYYYEQVLGDRTLADSRESACYVWDNHFDKKSGKNEYELSLFLQDEEDEDVFYRARELHVQRAYGWEQIRDLIIRSGMEFAAVYDAFTKGAPKEDSERLYFVAREKYQEGKSYV